MPGIAGILHATHDTPRSDLVRSMVQRMAHEKSWLCGDESFPGLEAAVGWVTRAGTYAGKLPVWNDDRTVCLLFTGEEFGMDERLEELVRRRGHGGMPEGLDALVHCYEELGPRFLRELNGRFSERLPGRFDGTFVWL